MANIRKMQHQYLYTGQKIVWKNKAWAINGTSSTPQTLESRSSVPLDTVIPGQDTGAPIGAGSESMHENVGTANGASSSPEWVVSNKEMGYGIKACPVQDCGYAGNNIEKHVYVSHLPACLNPILTFTPGQPHLPEERWQAICYLASLLDVSHPERLAEMAFTAIRPNHLRLGGGLSIGMAALTQYRGWEVTGPHSPLGSPHHISE